MPTINISSYTKSKISSKTDMDKSVVTFYCDSPISEWEARATNETITPQYNAGLLVGSDKYSYLENYNLNVDSNSDGKADGWEEGFSSNAVGEYVISQTYNCQEIKITNKTSSSAFLGLAYNDHISVTPSQSLSIKFDVRTTLTMNVGIGFTYYNSSRAYMYDADVTTSTSNNWQTFSYDTTVPSGAYYIQPYFYAYANSSSSGGSVYLKNGDLIKNGLPLQISANTNVSFDVDDEELTQGDRTYTISVYVKSGGVWYG